MMLSHAQVVQHGSWPPGGRDIAVPATVAVATQGRLRSPGDKRWRTFDESQIQKLKLRMIKICMTIWNNMSMLNICVFSAKLRKCSITLPNWCCWMDSRQTQTSREMKRSWGAQWEQNGFTASQPRSRLRRLERGAWPTQGLCFWSKAGTDPCAAWESWWRAFRSPSFWRIGDTPSLWFPIADYHDYPLNCWLPIADCKLCFSGEEMPPEVRAQLSSNSVRSCWLTEWTEMNWNCWLAIWVIPWNIPLIPIVFCLFLI